MEELRRSIRKLRVLNHRQRRFIPHESVYRVMTYEIIQKTLEDSGLARHALEEIAQVIAAGARKVFAILVLEDKASFITKFIENDQLQHSHLDHKLPFSREHLHSFLSQDDVDDLFYERQWEFTAPVFSGQVMLRCLDSQTIMPFLDENVVGRGGFGTVYSLDVHVDHCKFGTGSHRALVRKESESQGTPIVELENLAILKYLRHPNIIELLGSYTHGSRQNLIFPRARSGDLAGLLKGPRPSPFSMNTDFFIALAELASAIAAVHNFATGHPELAKSGCHHDLKPKNILVDGARFLLCDFGLSRFKNTEESSDTAFKIGEGYYQAPECHALEGSMSKGRIRRSSDVWSFGCILAEMLTYMMWGAVGIEQFIQKRRFNVDNWSFFYFHSGTLPNPGVVEWLDSLKLESENPSCTINPRSCGLYLSLVKEILDMVPAKRPKAVAVETRLCFIALDALAQHISMLYQDLTTKVSKEAILLYVERERFESWRWVLDMNDSETEGKADEAAPSPVDTDRLRTGFQETIRSLRDIDETLQTVSAAYGDARSSILSPLRHVTLKLLTTLPRGSRERAEARLQLRLLNSEEASHLQLLGDSFQGTTVDKRLLELAAMKRMTILTRDRPTTEVTPLATLPLIESGYSDSDLVHSPHKHVQKNDKITVHNFRSTEKVVGRIPSLDGEDRRVLVEWSYYGGSWTPRSAELLERVAGRVELLGSISRFEVLRVLHCCGFYHAPESFALGLVFEYPVRGPEVKLITLQQILGYDSLNMVYPHAKDNRPLLGSKYRLAHSLACSIFEFHKTGWLHKRISSYNIVFFSRTPEASSRDELIDNPYLVGFEHSRLDGSDDFSSLSEPDHVEYQHPNFSQWGRSCLELDFYSFGLVLLEVGLWKGLKEMTAGRSWEGITQEHFRRRLISRRVPQLGPTMGARYRDAVKACLEWEPPAYEGFESPNDEHGQKARDKERSILVPLEFQRLVLEPLASCSA